MKYINITPLNFLIFNFLIKKWINEFKIGKKITNLLLSVLNKYNEIIKKNKIEYKEKIDKIKIEINNNITSLAELFRDCNNIHKMTFNKFKIRDIKNMNKMFVMCMELEEINFNNFYTENVTNMQGMFFGCQKLVKLNLLNLIQ